MKLFGSFMKRSKDVDGFVLGQRAIVGFENPSFLAARLIEET